MTRRTATRIGVTAALVAALAAAWAVLAPPELGGSTRYAILEGTSMEPSLNAGDLALVRPADDVRRGDVVLYESDNLRAHVLHRIVRVDGDRFVLKGDNNDFLDSERPSADAVKGRLWLVIPNAGAALAWLHDPLHSALVVFPLAFLALGGGAAIAALRRPRRSRGPTRVAPEAHPAASGGADVARTALTVALCSVAVFALLAVVSHTRPTNRAEPTADAYAQVGTFSYGAEVGPSDVYPDGVVDTGETAFLQLVPALDVGFEYRLAATDASSVRGTTELTAVLSDGAGWTRRLPLAERTPFSGSAASASGVLDLVATSAIVEEMKTLTGSGASTFSLDVEAVVEMRGRVAGELVRKAFHPSLPLLLDQVSLRVDGSEGESVFRTRRAEAATVDVPASLALGALRVSVERARAVALLGLVLAVVAAVLAGVAARRLRRGGGLAQASSLFGDRLITISRPPSVAPQRVSEVTDAESLHRIAEYHDRIVLHWREGREYVYEVTEDGLAYRYRTGLEVEPGGVATADDEDTLVLSRPTRERRAAAG
jgi:signal peptidase I